MSKPAGTPVPPIRRVFLRFDKRLEKFVPCAEREASLTTPADGQGRPVMAVTGHVDVFSGRDSDGPAGWMFTEASPMIDPADVRARMTTAKRRT